MKLFAMIAVCVVSGAVISGCSVALVSGGSEGDVPPRLAIRDNAKTWNNGASFGPVPIALESDGDRICSSMNSTDKQYQAVGYHSKAQDLDGSTLPGGGYLCVKK
ncbi:hypothetical protein [Rhodoferax aquaticus]|uniref:DUF4156 domain-containing protein n=1 Tax=Rhodoferax aquaticus TaxID=2527691 RepID=A0A515EP50_9BURK|nr:hypothetical protein [Rhodoferax aquaticus]QDL54446.1 hypothetical protein EXZ61_09885 [Rhodoferax aquaticus]